MRSRRTATGWRRRCSPSTSRSGRMRRWSSPIAARRWSSTRGAWRLRSRAPPPAASARVGGVEAGIDRASWSLRPTVILVATAALVYLADQASKALVVASLDYGERVDVIGEFVRLWHLRNTGAAFKIGRAH